MSGHLHCHAFGDTSANKIPDGGTTQVVRDASGTPSQAPCRLRGPSTLSEIPCVVSSMLTVPIRTTFVGYATDPGSSLLVFQKQSSWFVVLHLGFGAVCADSAAATPTAIYNGHKLC